MTLCRLALWIESAQRALRGNMAAFRPAWVVSARLNWRYFGKKTRLRALFIFDDSRNTTFKQTRVLKEIHRTEITILEQIMPTAEMTWSCVSRLPCLFTYKYLILQLLQDIASKLKFDRIAVSSLALAVESVVSLTGWSWNRKEEGKHSDHTWRLGCYNCSCSRRVMQVVVGFNLKVTFHTDSFQRDTRCLNHNASGEKTEAVFWQ